MGIKNYFKLHLPNHKILSNFKNFPYLVSNIKFLLDLRIKKIICEGNINCITWISIINKISLNV